MLKFRSSEILHITLLTFRRHNFSIFVSVTNLRGLRDVEIQSYYTLLFPHYYLINKLHELGKQNDVCNCGDCECSFYLMIKNILLIPRNGQRGCLFYEMVYPLRGMSDVTVLVWVRVLERPVFLLCFKTYTQLEIYTNRGEFRETVWCMLRYSRYIFVRRKCSSENRSSIICSLHVVYV